MKYCSTVLSLFLILLSMLSAEAKEPIRSFECPLPGNVSVDSLFQSIPPQHIAIDAAQQKSRPAVLDRSNGYLFLSYRDSSGNTIEYTGALFTAGQNGKRTFLMIARTMHYIAQFPFTEGFWIYEYTPGTCINRTDDIFPWKNDGSLIKLPRKGTDVLRCIREGDEKGIKEVCSTFSWDTRTARFRGKK
jgi:hypothetical protein